MQRPRPTLRAPSLAPWLGALACAATTHCGDGSNGTDVLSHDATPAADARDGALTDGTLPDVAPGADAPGTDAPATDAPGAMDVAATDAAGDATTGGDGGRFHAPFDWVGVVGTGQSLSVGAAGAPIVDTTQPFHNLKLHDTGAAPQYPLDGGGVLTLVPLVEPIRSGVMGYTDSQYPNNIAGETPHTAMANQLTALAHAAGASDYVSLHSVVGWSGHCLVDIDREGNAGVVGRAYPGTLSEARTFTRLAAAMGHTFGYGAIVLTHGECDSGNAMYEQGLYQLYTDYNTDLRAITGQHTAIPLLLSQQSTEGAATPGASPLHESLISMWRVGVDHPGEVVCVGPKYQYQYAGDFLHLDGINYRRLGEKYAEVFDLIVNHGVAWHPLQPHAASRAGTTITVSFDVPDPPLAWEASLAAPHQTTNTAFAHGRGFEVIDSHGPQTISSVAIVGSTVTIQLAAAPTGTGLLVRYAATEDGTSGTHGGTVTGFRGQLRDSDPFVGFDAQSIACAVTTGSAMVTCPATNALAVRSTHDIVEGAGLADDTTVLATDRTTHATLSAPWTGAAGTVMLRFRTDQRNYCVHFELPVS